MSMYSSEKNIHPAMKESKCSHIKLTAAPTFLVGCKKSIIAFQTNKICKYKHSRLQFSKCISTWKKL